MKLTLSTILLSASLSAVAQAPVQQATLQSATVADSGFNVSGSWRGEFEGTSVIPFNFVVEKNVLYFINGEERFRAGELKQSGDSIFVPIDQFDNELALRINGASLTGVLRKADGSGTPLPLSAKKGKLPRFAQDGPQPSGDMSGTYDIVFNNNGKEEKAVGLFTQNGSKLTGTFLRITGDSRYLEGIVTGNQFYLSSFIGSSPSFYKGTFNKEGELKGEVGGLRGSSPFTGKANDNAALPDAYGLTYLRDGYKTLDFSFPDVNGKPVSLKDPKYKDKVVILTITGSWCPNCIDETSFLAPWFRSNRSRGVEAIGIHYERKADSAYVRAAMLKFRNRFDVQYDQVFAGIADKNVVAATLPALNTFLSFPTTILIDKKGQVAKIHTGYSGPATGKYYTDFVKEFNRDIDELLAQ